MGRPREASIEAANREMFPMIPPQVNGATRIVTLAATITPSGCFQ